MDKEIISCDVCTFFKRRKLYGKPCSELGILGFQPSCVSFEPDISLLRKSEINNPVGTILQSIREIDDRDGIVVASLLLRKARVSKYSKFAFLQPVYLRYIGSGNYLSHYCRARVLDATKNELKLVSMSNTITASVPNSGNSSVYSVRDFVSIRDACIENNNVIDPKQQMASCNVNNVVHRTFNDIYKTGDHSISMEKMKRAESSFLNKGMERPKDLSVVSSKKKSSSKKKTCFVGKGTDTQTIRMR